MNKKSLEQYWFELARSLQPAWFPGDATQGESPDIVLVRDGATIGVELTRYSNPARSGEPVPEEQTGLRKTVLHRAKRKFESRSETQLRVGVVFSPSAKLHPSRVQTLSDAIASWLLFRLAGQPEWTRAQADAGDEDGDWLPPELSAVFALVTPSLSNTHWYPAQAGWVSHASGEDVARIVAAKERKLASYREKCERAVLLIVFDGTPHSARAVHAPTEPLEFAISTKFDAVYCLDELERRLVSIPREAAV